MESRNSTEQFESWADDQRTKYREGKLTARRINALEVMPGWSWYSKSTTRQNQIPQQESLR
jgi:hypothetical protein